MRHYIEIVSEVEGQENIWTRVNLRESVIKELSEQNKIKVIALMASAHLRNLRYAKVLKK